MLRKIGSCIFFALSVSMMGMAGQANASVSAALQFNPSTVPSAHTSTLQIDLSSTDLLDTLFTTVSLPVLQSGLSYTGVTSTSCSGLSLAVILGSTTGVAVGLGTVPANSSCSISLEVQAPAVAAPTIYQASLPVAAFVFVDLQPSQPGATTTASLDVEPLSQITIGQNNFNPSVSGGTLPNIGLNCGAATVTGSYPLFTVPSGSNCAITVSGAAAPSGYTLGSMTFGGDGVSPSGTFTAPSGGINNVSVVTNLTSNSGSGMQSAISFSQNTFNPSISGGTLPVISLDCGSATVSGSYPDFSVPAGSNCVIVPTGAVAPAGYVLAGYTFTGTGVSPNGAFVASAEGISDIAVVTDITSLGGEGEQSQIIISANSFIPIIGGGTLPTIGLNCGTVTASGSYPNFSVPVGSNCMITTSGAVAPTGYELTGSVSFSGSGVSSTGAFTAPAAGINDIAVRTVVQLLNNGGSNGDGGGSGAGGSIVTVVEFYNSALDHYFISTNPQEIQDLDTGVHVGWERTGYSFLAYGTQVTGSGSVCRFYLKPEVGDSHFYSASPQECAETAQRFSQDWIYESPSVFYIALPDTMTGVCPQNTQPVWRFFHQPKTNHRYVTNTVLRDILRASPEWIPEGYGPDAVIMCAPRP